MRDAFNKREREKKLGIVCGVMSCALTGINDDKKKRSRKNLEIENSANSIYMLLFVSNLGAKKMCVCAMLAEFNNSALFSMIDKATFSTEMVTSPPLIYVGAYSS